ncbi:MAG: glutamine--tRNA ligase/YqeY domain fusion protein [Methylococcales bacterium]|jgi:glutaminyl-tRNA synthetase|nr:glutamine--tRNA ligase/YqeY domain fusion protein [Methylococcales bacterium]MBT7409901.1 glutamine--tRNA ligase/YqeY domain fusion protein [Methylococcales bacterium]
MPTPSKPQDFIRQTITNDLSNKKVSSITTRFPPEPNGYLHIGHAKSICLNFGVANDFNGQCNLRFDDTNPDKENPEYISAIKKDVEWLGFQWSNLFYASSYFDQLYDFAVQLIKLDKAYVCSLTAEEAREHRGSLTSAGKNSPYRSRSIEENLDLFSQMKAGKFDDGTQVLRAKIDMASPNINLRDPIIYRIRRADHHQTGKTWCIYPMYDFAHGLSDAIEGITHSLCTLEFEDHRPLYDWFLDQLKTPAHPQQIEFSRLNLEYTITSKRKLNLLVTNHHVESWDDPRMPTISGLRRRGYTANAIKDFCDRIGVTKVENTIEMGVLENCIREDLGEKAPRALAVLNPLKITLKNYPDDQTESLNAPNHPQKEEMDSRKVPFSKTLFIDRDDFREQANKKYKRLVLGKEVRLRYAYVIKCEEVIKDENDNILELICSYDAQTLGKNPEDRKVKGVIHWVSAEQSIESEIRLYDRLFNVANPASEEDFESTINPNSLKTLKKCRIENSLNNAQPSQAYQFEREGYFCLDSSANKTDIPIFNRIVTLRDTWAKIATKG